MATYESEVMNQMNYNYLKIKSNRRLLDDAKWFITFSLKSFISVIIMFSIEIIARALNITQL